MSDAMSSTCRGVTPGAAFARNVANTSATTRPAAAIASISPGVFSSITASTVARSQAEGDFAERVAGLHRAHRGRRLLERVHLADVRVELARRHQLHERGEDGGAALARHLVAAQLPDERL